MNNESEKLLFDILNSKLLNEDYKKLLYELNYRIKRKQINLYNFDSPLDELSIKIKHVELSNNDIKAIRNMLDIITKPLSNYSNNDFDFMLKYLDTDQLDDYMYMYQDIIDGKLIKHYKHYITRDYINIDKDGNFYDLVDNHLVKTNKPIKSIC